MHKNYFRVTSALSCLQKMPVCFLYFLFKLKGVKSTSMSNKICRK